MDNGQHITDEQLNDKEKLIAELQRENEELRRTCADIKKDLILRTKEGRLTYSINSLMERDDLSYEGAIREIVNLIPDSWTFPLGSELYIKWNSIEYVSPSFRNDMHEAFELKFVTTNTVPGVLKIYTPSRQELTENQKGLCHFIADNLSKLCTQHRILKKQVAIFTDLPQATCIIEAKENHFILSQGNALFFETLEITDKDGVLNKPISALPFFTVSEVKRFENGFAERDEIKNYILSYQTFDSKVRKFSFNATLCSYGSNRCFICTIYELENEEQREEIDLYRKLTNTLPVGLWMIDKKGKLIYQNDISDNSIDLPFLNQTLGLFSTSRIDKPNNTEIPALNIAKPKENEIITKEWYDKANDKYFNIYLTAVVHHNEMHYLIAAVNTTQSKKKHAKINFELQRYKLLANKLPYAIVKVDIDGKILNINEKAENMFCFNPRDLSYPSLTQIAQQPTKLQNLHTKVLQSGTFSASNYHLVTKNNVAFLADIHGFRLSDPETSKYYCLFFIKENETEQADKLEDREDTIEELTRVLDSSNEAFFTANAHLEIEYSNKQVCAMLGYTTMDELAEDLLDGIVVPPEHIIEVMERLDKIGYVKDFLTTAKHKNGSELNISVSISKTLNPDGSLRHYLAVAKDITAECVANKRLEATAQKALENEKRLRAITEQVTDGITLTNSKTGKFEYANEAFCRMTQYSNEELLNLTAFGMEATPIKEETFFCAVNAQSRNTIGKRIQLIKKDGSLLTNDMHVRKLQLNNIDYQLSVHRDSTPLINKEQELTRAKEKAEASEKAKVDFLMKVTHEIRTPLNGILGFIDLLKDPELSESHNGFLDVISQSGEKLLKTINELLKISKTEKATETTDYEELHVCNLIRYHYDFFKPEAEAKGIELKLHNDLNNEQSFIHSDKKMITGILTNLIKNAIKFTDHGEVNIYCTKENDLLKIDIEDTGIGISEEMAEEIFTPYVQAENAESNTTEGTGLGLSIVAQYIKQLNGTIELESEKGKGSKFKIALPLNNKTGNEQADGKATKWRILLLETDQINAKYMDHILKDYELTIVANENEAIRKATNADFDIIIINPSSMDASLGATLVSKLRTAKPNTPILMQSALVNTEIEQKIFDAGCSETINIPFTKHQLIKVVEQLCHNSKK